jgi:transcriptional regulator with XRE-family HTH domain
MKAKSFTDLSREAERHDDYRVAGLVTEFTECLSRRMEEHGVSRTELARRLGTSQAYVTKVLRGNVNFTLATLVKLALAVGAEVRRSPCDPSARATERATRPVRRPGPSERGVATAR